MELNGLQFSKEQLAELYSDTLIVTETPTPQPVSKTAPVVEPPLPVKGKNKKGVLWLVQEPDHAYLNDADFEFLSQIVGACKMNMEDIALVNLAHTSKTIKEVTDALQPSVVILCGIEYQQLPFKLDEYLIYPYAGRNYFLADRLEDLRNDKAKKNKTMAGIESHVLTLIMHQLILATSNPNKAKEIQSVLPEGFDVITMKEAGLDVEIPEPFHTLEENSLHKAQTIYLISGQDCFAEDTGLEVEALQGAPGVVSARYAGEPRNDQRNIEKLLHELNGTNNRAAQFRTVMTLFLDGEAHQFEGICKGQIIESPTGTEGFGYDPIFIPEGSTHTFAEMALQEKNTFSHRKKALVKMIDFLTTYPTD